MGKNTNNYKYILFKPLLLCIYFLLFLFILLLVNNPFSKILTIVIPLIINNLIGNLPNVTSYKYQKNEFKRLCSQITICLTFIYIFLIFGIAFSNYHIKLGTDIKVECVYFILYFLLIFMGALIIAFARNKMVNILIREDKA